MSTFGEVIDGVIFKTKSVADKVGQKTTEFIDVTKLRIDKSEIEREIASIHEGIGRLVYDWKVNGEDVNELIDGCVVKLQEKQRDLEAIKDKIDDLKSVLRCVECGSPNEEDATFCKRCGKSVR